MKILSEEKRKLAEKGMIKNWVRNNKIVNADIALSDVKAYIASAEKALDKLASAYDVLKINDGRCDDVIDYLQETRQKMIPFLEEPLQQFKDKVGYTE